MTKFEETQSAVSCMYEGNQFATMKVDLQQKEVVIFDGILGKAQTLLTKWYKYVEYI